MAIIHWSGMVERKGINNASTGHYIRVFSRKNDFLYKIHKMLWEPSCTSIATTIFLCPKERWQFVIRLKARTHFRGRVVSEVAEAIHVVRYYRLYRNSPFIRSILLMMFYKMASFYSSTHRHLYIQQHSRGQRSRVHEKNGQTFTRSRPRTASTASQKNPSLLSFARLFHSTGQRKSYQTIVDVKKLRIVVCVLFYLRNSCRHLQSSLRTGF